MDKPTWKNADIMETLWIEQVAKPTYKATSFPQVCGFVFCDLLWQN